MTSLLSVIPSVQRGIFLDTKISPRFYLNHYPPRRLIDNLLIEGVPLFLLGRLKRIFSCFTRGRSWSSINSRKTRKGELNMVELNGLIK